MLNRLKWQVKLTNAHVGIDVNHVAPLLQDLLLINIKIIYKCLKLTFINP